MAPDLFYRPATALNLHLYCLAMALNNLHCLALSLDHGYHLTVALKHFQRLAMALVYLYKKNKKRVLNYLHGDTFLLMQGF